MGRGEPTATPPARLPMAASMQVTEDDGRDQPLLEEEPEEQLLLGQGSPMLVNGAYVSTIAALAVLAFVVDWEPSVPMFSKVVLAAQAGVGFTFTVFGYFLNPNLLCMAANFFHLL